MTNRQESNFTRRSTDRDSLRGRERREPGCIYSLTVDRETQSKRGKDGKTGRKA